MRVKSDTNWTMGTVILNLLNIATVLHLTILDGTFNYFCKKLVRVPIKIVTEYKWSESTFLTWSYLLAFSISNLRRLFTLSLQNYRDKSTQLNSALFKQLFTSQQYEEKIPKQFQLQTLGIIYIVKIPSIFSKPRISKSSEKKRPISMCTRTIFVRVNKKSRC